MCARNCSFSECIIYVSCLFGLSSKSVSRFDGTVWRRSRWQYSKRKWVADLSEFFWSADHIYQKLARSAENHEVFDRRCDELAKWNWMMVRLTFLKHRPQITSSGEKPPKSVIMKQVPRVIWNQSCCLSSCVEYYCIVNPEQKSMSQLAVELRLSLEKRLFN